MHGLAYDDGKKENRKETNTTVLLSVLLHEYEKEYDLH